MTHTTSRLMREERWIGKVCLFTFCRYLNWKGWMIRWKMLQRCYLLWAWWLSVEHSNLKWEGRVKLYGSSALWAVIIHFIYNADRKIDKLKGKKQDQRSKTFFNEKNMNISTYLVHLKMASGGIQSSQVKSELPYPNHSIMSWKKSYKKNNVLHHYRPI